MILPKNTAAFDAQNDQGLLSQDQLKKNIEKEQETTLKRELLWAKVASAKKPIDYKTLITDFGDSSDLLELLEIDNARTTILASARLSPAYYFKLKKIIDMEKIDLKALLISAIDERYK